MPSRHILQLHVFPRIGLLIPELEATLEAQKNQLVNDLGDLLEDKTKTMVAVDATRSSQLAEHFHNAFVPWLAEAIEKRPSLADPVYCKTRCQEPAFQRGYQHGVSMYLSVLGSSILQYHESGLSEEAKKSDFYPYNWRREYTKFAVGKDSAEMLDPKMRLKKGGVLHTLGKRS